MPNGWRGAFRWSVVLCAATAVIACGTVPVTGRSQLNVFSDQELLSSANASFDKFITDARSQNAVLQASESAAAANTLAAVRRVSERIIDAAGLRGRYRWETIVVKSKTPNAMVMPNGKIIVFTGILPIAKNDAGLAAIIGHEVAHVVARHAAERLSQTLLTKTVLSVADAAVAAKNGGTQPAVSAALGLGAQYGLLLPFSREHESEADHIGLLYMAKAGYDPAEAIGVWERMEQASGAGPWEMLSTHPSHGTRRTKLREWQAEAQLYYTDRNKPLPVSLEALQSEISRQVSKNASAPIAVAPDYPPGFWYSVTSPGKAAKTTFRLEHKGRCDIGECLFVVGSNGSKLTLGKTLELLRNDEPDGTWSQYSPPVRQLKFPLAVGDSWGDTVTITNAKGVTTKLNLKFTVAGYDPVTVKAGTFMAYKIISAANGARFREMWYAPETRTFVKSISIDARGTESLSELIDYSKEKDRLTEL